MYREQSQFLVLLEKKAGIEADMQLPFVILASAISFLSLVGHIMALSQIEDAKYLNALESIGQNTAADPNMATNGTLDDGAPCYEDGLYSAFSAYSSDIVPFCSSYLSIAAVTVSAACTTTTT